LQKPEQEFQQWADPHPSRLFPLPRSSIMFADEFNRKENLEALVVSSSN
jgi:hypothetical protein